MAGFKPAAQAAKKKAGAGPVRGPGTGTSDEVKEAVPPGTYIMPADSTEEIGEPALAGLGFKPRGAAGEVPVNLSNGEYKLPPEQVHAVGAQVLDAMKEATHAPVEARGFRPGMAPPQQKATNELYFADGGVVEDPSKKPRSLATSPSNTYPGNQAEAAGSIYAQSNEELARGFRGAMDGLDGAATYLNRGDPVKDAVQAVGGFFARSAEQARQPSTWDDSGTRPQFAEDKPQPAPAAAATTAAVKPAPAAPAAAAPPAANSAPAQPAAAPAVTQPPATPGGFPGKPTDIAGVTRIDEPGKSPMFTNVGSGGSPAAGGPGLGFQPGAAGTSPDVLGILQRESQIRAGMAPLMDQIRFNEGTRGNGNYFGFRRPSADEGGAAVLADPSVERNAERDRSAAMSAASRPMPGSPNGQLTASQRSQMVDMVGRDQTAATARYQADSSAAVQRDTTAMREAGEASRSAQREAGANARAQAASQIQQDELGLKREAQGFQTREAQRREGLVAKYEAAKTPEEKSAIAQQIRDLSGKQEPQNRFTVVPGGQEWDAASGAMRNVPARVLNNQTGQFVDGERQAGAQPQAMPTDKSKLAAGQIYQTARGPARWDGNQFVGV